MFSVLFVLLSATLAARADVVTFYTNRAVWQAAAPSLTDIDFSGIAPAGVAVSFPAGLTIDGVNFLGQTDQAGWLNVIDQAFCCSTYQRGQVASLSWAAATSVQAGTNGRIVITLPAGVTAVGMDLFEVQFGDGSGVTSDTINMVLSDGFSSSVLTSPAPNLVFLGFTSDTPIASITMTGTSAEDFPDMANFSFGLNNAEVVPEPASLILLGTLLLPIALVARRRLVGHSHRPSGS